MGYSLQKEAGAKQRGRGARQKSMPLRGNQDLRRRWLLRRECPSPARQRRGLKGEEGAVGVRPVPAGRHPEEATEPGGSFSLASSPRIKPRAEVPD